MLTLVLLRYEDPLLFYAKLKSYYVQKYHKMATDGLRPAEVSHVSGPSVTFCSLN